MEPLVSVIIPVYNVLSYLREALDSVINQTYKNLEILIVDDGSTDGSGDVCDEYLSDPRVIVIHQENKGLSGARNTGLDRMTGEYVAFLDSDDAFMPEMIEKMLDAMIQNQAEISICTYATCTTIKHMNLEKAEKGFPFLYETNHSISSADALNKMIVSGTGSYVWNKLYHYSVWIGTRFPEGDNYEDMRVICQVLEKCEHVIAIPLYLVLYRQRSGSITTSISGKNVLDHILAMKIVEEYALSHSPEIFTPNSILSIQENHARSLSVQYAMLLFHPCPSPVRLQIRNEILNRWQLLARNPLLLRSKVIYTLFMYAPLLILPIHTLWDLRTRLLRRRTN